MSTLRFALCLTCGFLGTTDEFTGPLCNEPDCPDTEGQMSCSEIDCLIEHKFIEMGIEESTPAQKVVEDWFYSLLDSGYSMDGAVNEIARQGDYAAEVLSDADFRRRLIWTVPAIPVYADPAKRAAVRNG